MTRGDQVLIQGSVDYDGVHVVGSLSPEDPAQRVSYVRDYWALLNMTAKVEQRRARVVKKKYTPTGSHVTDVPPAVWASVSTYYFNNAHAGFPEGWLETAEHVNVNFWDSRPDIIAVPSRVKREWQAGLMAGVSSWGGGVDLERVRTSCFPRSHTFVERLAPAVAAHGLGMGAAHRLPGGKRP